MSLQLALTSKPVREGLAPPLCAFLVANKKRTAIPSVARNPLFLSDRKAAGYNEAQGGSAGIDEGFGGLDALAGTATGLACFGGPGAATVKYLRIFSMRFGPMPRIARKSSTLLNGPYDLRICKIFSAVAGPIPGTSCNCSAFAVFKLIGAAGGFFFAKSAAGSRQQMANRKAARFSKV